MNPERLRDKYPIFYAYGVRQTFLDSESAIAATVEGRIRSVWPFLVRRVLAFSHSLKPRERANFDPEDVLTEVWVALARKDSQWAPGRGKYLTFAATIIVRELYAIRDKARTVQSPRNSSCRLKKYRAGEEAGTLTDRRRQTAADIRRTGQVAASIGPRGATEDEEGCSFEPMTLDDPLATLAARERADGMRSGLRDALRRVTPFEAEVVTRIAGLGCESMPIRELASAVGRTEVEIRRAKERAFSKIRKHLIATRHPALHERN